MKKAERVQFILDTLEQYYPETPIPLNHTDAYTLLVSVLLSAQCTDERVNQITPLLFEKANNPADMLKLSVEEIQNIIRPCGLSPMKMICRWALFQRSFGMSLLRSRSVSSTLLAALSLQR